jgi:hypothetical protein
MLSSRPRASNRTGLLLDLHVNRRHWGHTLLRIYLGQAHSTLTCQFFHKEVAMALSIATAKATGKRLLAHFRYAGLSKHAGYWRSL